MMTYLRAAANNEWREARVWSAMPTPFAIIFAFHVIP
jgi:hypothetical protein